MKKTNIITLINLIEEVISKNRDLLSVDDIRNLKRCIEDLERIRDSINLKTTFEYASIVVQIIIHLVNFFDSK